MSTILLNVLSQIESAHDTILQHDMRTKICHKIISTKMLALFSLLIVLVFLGSCEAFHHAGRIRSFIPSTMLRMAVIQPEKWPGQSAPLGYWDPLGDKFPIHNTPFLFLNFPHPSSYSMHDFYSFRILHMVG